MDKTTNKYTPEVRECAGRMVLNGAGQHESRWSAIVSICVKIGCAPQMLNEWVKKVAVDIGQRGGLTTDQGEKMKALEREVRALKQAGKLADLAPISKQSGKWQGKEHIQGGRASIRHAVYLPAVVATRFNPDMKAKYEQLVSTGTCKKLAITAVMRKLIVMANALLRDRRKWNEYPA